MKQITYTILSIIIVVINTDTQATVHQIFREISGAKKTYQSSVGFQHKPVFEQPSSSNSDCSRLTTCAGKQFGVDDIKSKPAIKTSKILLHVKGQTLTGKTVTGTGELLEDGTESGFLNEIDAVVAAVNRYNPRSISDDREYMGVVLMKNKQFYYTAQMGIYGNDKITIRIPIPEGYRFVAIWHTHGAADLGRNYFSDVDTKLVSIIKKRFYLGDYTGLLKVFSPGDRIFPPYRARSLGLPEKKGYGKGRLVKDGSGTVIHVAT